MSSETKTQTKEEEIKMPQTKPNGNGNPYKTAMADIMTPAVFPGISSSGALKELMELITAIPDDRVRRLNLSAPQAVAAGRHYARCYTEDRAAFIQSLNPSVFDPVSYDNLVKRAEALWEADVLLKKPRKTTTMYQKPRTKHAR